MSKSAEAPASSGSDQKSAPPPPSTGDSNGNTPGSGQAAADPPSNGDNNAGNVTSPAAPPPENQQSPPPPASPPPENKSPPPPLLSPPPPKEVVSPPPAKPETPTPTPPPPAPIAQESPPSPSQPAPPPPADAKHSPPPSPPPPPASTPPNEESPPTLSPPPPGTSPTGMTPPPPEFPSSSPPPPENLSQPILSPPSPTGALAPRVSPEPVGCLTPNCSSHVPPRTGNLGPASGTMKGKVERPAGNSDGNSLPVAVGVGVAGVFIVALVTIFFVVAKRNKKRNRGGIPGNYIPPKNFSGNSDGYLYGQPQSGMFPGQSDPFSSYSYENSQIQANSNGSQRGNHGSGGVPDSDVLGGAKSFFSYAEILEMTNGFSAQSVIGEGGFGSVYKGHLPDGKPVAVKNLKSGSGQGEREFMAEVEIISRVHHKHLVSLVGYCIAKEHRVLIYEFVSNNTLEHHLHDKGLPVLEWSKRMKIALGAAKGLAYLHEDCHPKIIHRDIKSANILLEDDFEAQVADFGLARPNTDAHTHVSTRVMGTFGYLAPEYASSGKLTDKSDVYSFGVVLLELITGRKPVDTSQPFGDESLVEWARPVLLRALETHDLSEAVDPRLQKHYVESEMFRMIEAAAACIRHSSPKRPRMMQVVRALDCEGEMSDLSNGVKYGQSAIMYNSGQYDKDIEKFKRMAFGSGECSDFEYTGEHISKDYIIGPQNRSPSWGSRNSSCQSFGSETTALNNSSNH